MIIIFIVWHRYSGTPMYDGFDDSSTFMSGSIALLFAQHYPSPVSMLVHLRAPSAEMFLIRIFLLASHKWHVWQFPDNIKQTFWNL